MRTLVVLALVAAAGCNNPEPSSREPQSIPEPHAPLPGGPSIVSAEPASVVVADIVTITGTGFGMEPGRVLLDGLEATVTSWTSTAVEILVPDVYPGSKDVALETVRGVASSALRVTLPAVAFVNEDRVAGNTISAFRIPANAQPEMMASSPFPTGASAAGFGGDSRSIALHAPTRRLFATNEDSVAVFDVHGATGELQPVPGSPFATGVTRCFGIAVSSDGTRVFVASYAASAVVVFAVGPGGSLSPIPGSPVALSAAGGPDSLQLAPDGRFLYVNLEDTQAMEVLAVAADGSLSRIEGSPFPYAGSSFAYSLRLDPQGRHAYVPDSSQERIAVYRLDPSTGAPTEIAGSPFPAAGMVHGLAFARDGQRLFATTDDSAALIHAFTVAADGSLSALPGSPFPSGLSDTSSVEVGADGTRLYVVDESSNRLAVFSVGGCGAPVPLATVIIDVADGQPSGLVLGR